MSHSKCAHVTGTSRPTGGVPVTSTTSEDVILSPVRMREGAMTHPTRIAICGRSLLLTLVADSLAGRPRQALRSGATTSLRDADDPLAAASHSSATEPKPQRRRLMPGKSSLPVVVLCALALSLVLWPAAAEAACSDPPAPYVDWIGCDKSGADLSNANLRNADLTGANLTGANLSGATCGAPT